MTDKNLMITLDDGLIKTCLLPVFSALLMAFKASANTEVLVILGLNVSNYLVKPKSLMSVPVEDS